MANLASILPDLFLILIGFFLVYYAVADGFDLGVGMLSMFARSEEERSYMMATIDSTWHANQTWLVLTGGMMFGAFPLFYSVILSSLYIPIMAMLFAFMIRGVALDYYGHSERKPLWGLAFGLGSLLVTLAQGFALGGLLAGLNVTNGQFTGSVIRSWLNPLAGFVTVGVLFGYLMLGASYLILRTEGELQQRSYRYAWPTSIVTVLISVGVYLWLIARYASMARKWITFPDFYYAAFFPLLAVLAVLLFLFSLWKRYEKAPLLWNAAIVFFSFIGVSLGLYPNMIPNVISPVTVHDAAASTRTLFFMFWVMCAVVPIIMVYTIYTNWVFRGKAEAGYGEEGE